MLIRSRFAPSTTGHAHPGTLLAGLLAWLDIRSKGGKFLLRFEDLDPQRCKEQLYFSMLSDLEWFGLDWDLMQKQSDRIPHYEEAMDQLQQNGRLYPCHCTRTQIKKHGIRGPDGGWAYPNTCRNNTMPPGGWRQTQSPLRIRLDDELIRLSDESGTLIQQNPGEEIGDPIARRRDGSFAYNLVSVVDDGLAQINRIVRGRDLINSCATHWNLRNILGYPHPSYRHHLLFLEKQDQKLAKFRKSVGMTQLRQAYTPKKLCGFIAWSIELIPTPIEIAPEELINGFNWKNVTPKNTIVEWDGKTLRTKDIEKSKN